MMNRRATIATVLCIALAGVLAFAQFETATLTGTITDAAGAVVPNATIKAVNEATNIESTAVANGEGRYLFPNLRPGSYRVMGSAQGFKQSVPPGGGLAGKQAPPPGHHLTGRAVT